MESIFNNPRYLSRSWYAILPSRRLKAGKALSIPFFDHKVALFRQENGTVSALFAVCPHMGADLGLGKVVGKNLICPYHKWAFNEGGKCTRVVGQSTKPEAHSTPAYPVTEKYGFIWVFNGETADFPLPTLPWDEKEHILLTFPQNFLNCHPHIVGTNNPDFSHLETLHGFQFDVKPVQENQRFQLVYRYVLNYHPKNLFEKAYRFVFGGKYKFHIIQHGSSNIIMDITSSRYQFRTLISLIPTKEGKTASRFFLFLPKGNLLSRTLGLPLLKLPFLLASILKVQLQDLSIYNNIDFVLPEYEEPIVEHKKFIESLGAFHPHDPTKNRPRTSSVV